MSCVLVAVTVTGLAVAGAVKSPDELIVPAVDDHVTVELKLPVPSTVALHCEVELVPMVDGAHVAATEVIVDAAACTVTDAVADLVVSCVLVAVMVTDPAVAGAANSPAVLMAPAAADHVTAELKLPVPCTVALHCDVACAATEEGVHETATEEMEEDGGGGLLLEPPPPQAVAISKMTLARSVDWN